MANIWREERRWLDDGRHYWAATAATNVTAATAAATVTAAANAAAQTSVARCGFKRIKRANRDAGNRRRRSLESRANEKDEGEEIEGYDVRRCVEEWQWTLRQPSLVYAR